MNSATQVSAIQARIAQLQQRLQQLQAGGGAPPPGAQPPPGAVPGVQPMSGAPPQVPPATPMGPPAAAYAPGMAPPGAYGAGGGFGAAWMNEQSMASAPPLTSYMAGPPQPTPPAGDVSAKMPGYHARAGGAGDIQANSNAESRMASQMSAYGGAMPAGGTMAMSKNPGGPYLSDVNRGGEKMGFGGPPSADVQANANSMDAARREAAGMRRADDIRMAGRGGF